MRRFVLVCIVALVGCNSGPSRDYSEYVMSQCKHDREKFACREKCSPGEDGTHRICYRDKRRETHAEDVSWQCFATHVGDRCPPCEEIYAINYAGALSTVTCEEYYQRIVGKNKRCNNCLETTETLD